MVVIFYQYNITEDKREKVRSKQQIGFVTKHTGKTENSLLPNPRPASQVNKPISDGIEPVSLFEPINVITF